MILGRVGGEGERHSPSLESEAAPSRGLAELHVPAKENDAKVFSGSLDPGKYLCVILRSGCMEGYRGQFLNHSKTGGSCG